MIASTVARIATSFNLNSSPARLNGNVLEWMQNGDYAYTQRIRKALDKEDKGMVSNTNNRLLRGGSFSGSASNVRSSDRYSYRPDVPSLSNGFRPSRTFR